LGLRGPFLIAFGGGADQGRSDCARAAAELSGAKLLTYETVRIPLHEREAPPDMAFDALCVEMKRELAHGRAVVIEWPLNRLEERLRVAQIAAQVGVPSLLVQCSMSMEALVHRNGAAPSAAAPADLRRLSARPSPPWQNEWASAFLSCLLLEATLPQPDLALLVLRTLVMR
jgi:predicted kinase